MTPELKLGADALRAKGKACKAERKAIMDHQRAMRQPYTDAVEKTRSSGREEVAVPDLKPTAASYFW